uniref:Helicase ATP-binding domain-containing protein n=1 Tax=viral metagenome TaxID=1070528 RepID=A0A6C0LTB3_9ZZZZ
MAHTKIKRRFIETSKTEHNEDGLYTFFNNYDYDSNVQNQHIGGKNNFEVSNEEITELTLDEKMLEDHTYPSPSQETFQHDIYVKRDYYIHNIPYRDKLKTYDEIKEFRDNVCARDFKLREHQALLANFINPNTPFKGLLIFHGTGTGKTCASIGIAEKFKSMVEKYGMRIHVLVPGPLNKQDFMGEILNCTGETYLKMYQDKTMIIDEIEMAKNRKNALNIANQYYRIMSYRSFYKKVLGEKIIEKITTDQNKLKIAYRKTSTGEYERDLSTDRIYNLDNTLLIVDEAHNLTGNEYGDAVKKIIEISKNLRIVLLSATPMKNLADDSIELLNYLRPINSPIERDKVFTSQRGHLMEFKSNGKDYFRKMILGYISYLRGADPLTFAERIDMGEIPTGLNFTKVIRCYMLNFQLKTYSKVVESQDDSLDRRSEAVANFAFPGLSKDKSSIEGYYGIEGMGIVRSQMKNNAEILIEKITSTILSDYKIENPSNLIYLTNDSKKISGDIFHEKYLKFFSIKFYTTLHKINETIYGKRGIGLLFIYSNLVKVGIEIFQEILLANGYLEYQDNITNYHIDDDTRCYFCEYNYSHHKHLPNNIPRHDFYPATFISITGKSEENLEQIPEEKHKILRTVFNNIENKDGKFIKIVIGSKVMNEGITLKNIKEIHILDVHFNLGKVDQVIGRGIRFCKHYDIINDDNQFPKVEIYKYVVSLKDGLSTEEQLYKKAEQKYKLIKETERIFQEEAIDCPLNRNGNIFPEELEKYGNCGTIEKPCPAVCGYMSCEFKCGDKLLNAKYYDPEKNIYKKVAKADLDYSTYDNSLASEEIEYAKSKIKEMFHLKHMYTIKDILKYVKKSYPIEKRDLFDDYYVYQALNDLIPMNGNDFNNFKDTFTDKFNIPGYLIYRKNYYIFQAFDENENVPMYYRYHYHPDIINKFNLKDYIKHTTDYHRYKEINEEVNDLGEKNRTNFTKTYDFDSGLEYYDSRNEYDYVGTIDQESIRRRVGVGEEMKDEFKIREKRPKILSKKRETGIPSFRGAVCKTSKNKKFLLKIAEKLQVSTKNINIRMDICNLIKDKLFDLEKYSTTKQNNKMTYLIVPSNHQNIPFPLNLEDRIKILINEIQIETRSMINCKINTEDIKNGKFSDIHYVKYHIIFDNSMDKFKNILEAHGALKIKDNYVIIVE